MRATLIVDDGVDDVQPSFVGVDAAANAFDAVMIKMLDVEVGQLISVWQANPFLLFSKISQNLELALVTHNNMGRL